MIVWHVYRQSNLTKATFSEDFDGKYSLDLEPGEYTLTFSFVGYQTIEVSEVIIKSDEIAEAFNSYFSEITLTEEQSSCILDRAYEIRQSKFKLFYVFVQRF